MLIDPDRMELSFLKIFTIQFGIMTFCFILLKYVLK